MPGPGHAPPRCAAIPGCRRFRSGHTACPEKECGVREISPRKIRNATAERHRCSADSQRLTGAASAGISNCDRLDKRAASPESSIPWNGWTLKHGKKQTPCRAGYNENDKE